MRRDTFFLTDTEKISRKIPVQKSKKVLPQPSRLIPIVIPATPV